MNLRVIEGGLLAVLDETDSSLRVSALDVRLEAARRLKEAGYEQCRVRSLATGQAIPTAMRHLRVQIDLIADKLSMLSPVPEDYHRDIYWPPQGQKRVWPECQ